MQLSFRMFDSVHGAAKDLYSAAFGEEEECKHLDTKNFLVSIYTLVDV